MALITQTLLGVNNKIETAIDRILFAYKQAVMRKLGALYVCFSGGKDSVVIAHLCELAGVPYELHYNMTGIDPPEVTQFMKENYPNLIWHKYEKSMFELIIEKHIPPIRTARYCCAELKERGGENRMCITGVRWAESSRRKNNRKAFETFDTKSKILFNDNEEDRKLLEVCPFKGKYITNPIVDWEESDVWEFIKMYNLPYCKLYDEGFKRIGCIGCPMATVKDKQKEFERWSGFKNAYISCFDKMLENRPKDLSTTWKTGEDVFNWWLYGDSKQQDKDTINFLGGE